MKIKRFIFVALLFLYCSSTEQRNSENEALSNVLSLESTIGGDEYSEEFLLVKPRDIAVNADNDIFILDEDRVKVFDSNGREKDIFGNPGQGPGEFERSSSIYLGPTGIVIVRDRKGINFYSSSHNFVKSLRASSDPNLKSVENKVGAKFSQYVKTFPLTGEKVIAQYSGKTDSDEIKGKDRKEYYTLLYKSSNSTKEILLSQDKSTLYTDVGVARLSYRGELKWGVFGENKVIFHEPEYEKLANISDQTYSLNFLDLDTFEKRTVIHQYTPATLPDSIRNRYNKFSGRENIPDEMVKVFETLYKHIDSIVKEDIYYPPVKELFSDGSLLFVFTNYKNDIGEIFVDIFDMGKEKYIHSAYFSVFPDFIKNGYAYEIVTGADILPEVRKYKISDIVYAN